MIIEQTVFLNPQEKDQVLDAYQRAFGDEFVNDIITGRHSTIRLRATSNSKLYKLYIDAGESDVADFILGIIHHDEVEAAILEVSERIKSKEE